MPFPIQGDVRPPFKTLLSQHTSDRALSNCRLAVIWVGQTLSNYIRLYFRDIEPPIVFYCFLQSAMIQLKIIFSPITHHS